VTTDIATAILETREYVLAWSRAANYPLPFAIKRRDPIEPGRDIKEAAENSLYRITRQYWSRQKKYLRDWMRFRYPFRKAEIPFTELLGMYDDELYNALVLKWLQKAVKNGVILFSDANLIGINYDLVNVSAANWARKYSGLLVKSIDDTTRKMIRQQISAFVETPGYSVGDVMSMLPFGEKRAFLIATTETTKTYAMAEQLAGNQLKKEFPEMRVIKQWFTNNDARVCEICRPNHTKITLIDGVFPSGHARPTAHPRCNCWMSTTTDVNETAVLWNEAQ